MSQNLSPEEQLKEAVKTSKLALALNEQVTALASEKETLIKRLAEVEKAISSPKAESTSVGDEVKALLEAQASKIAELTAKFEASLEPQAKRAKADLNKYVEQKEDGTYEKDEKNEKEEACGPEWQKKGKGKATDPDEAPTQLPPLPEEIHIKMKGKGKKADSDLSNPTKEDTKDFDKQFPQPGLNKNSKKAKAMDDSDYGDLSDEEVMLIKQYRQQNEEDYSAKKGKKADATLDKPFEEDSKNFGETLDQPGLDPNKNKVDEDNTTSPTMAKKASKVKAETDVEEINESKDQQIKEDKTGEEEEEEHEKTLSKKGKKASKKGWDEDEPTKFPPVDTHDAECEPMKKGKKAENSIGGVNNKEVVRTKEEVEEEGEGSFLNKKDAKKADEVVPAPVAEEVKSDSVIEEAVQKLAAIAQAKVKAEQENVSMRDMLALETKAKTEAMAAVESLHKKFEALMGKVAQIEGSDRTLEAKAAKIVSAQGVEPLASAPENEVKVKTDSDYLAEFEAIKNPREQNKFFNAHRTQIERAAFTNLRKRS